MFMNASRADEGMWIPLLLEQINYEEMQEMGLKLTPEMIYSVNNSSLKDAIVIFGRGCTGEIISGEGLILTNHHCGYGQIQAHSSVEHDYLKDGFWAMSRQEELPNPGLTASFLVRIEDVTGRVMQALDDEMTEEQRSGKVREVSGTISGEATEGTPYNALVRSFYGGNEYYLFVYETFRDVRFVGAPPSSIGKFGADTDNWMWPRHTGDFSLFRVYSAPDGTPADFAEENVPLKPKHFLPVSLKGVEKGDFSMIMGYPGSTDRYLTSYGVEMAVGKYNPTVVSIREKKLEIMREDMDADPEIRIKYATKYARTSNYWKYYIGQTKGLHRLNVEEKKRAIEKDFVEWVDQDPERKERYGEVIPEIEDAYKTINQYILSNIYFREAVARGPELPGFAHNFSKLAEELDSKDADQEKIGKIVDNLRKYADNYFKDYHLPTDRELFAAMMEMYHLNVPSAQQPPFLKDIAAKYRNDFSAYAGDVFDRSLFTTSDHVMQLLENPKAKKIRKDPAFIVYQEFSKKYRELSEAMSEAYTRLNKANRLFIAGLREMHPDKTFYPDANFTMRLSYGTVQDYYPADAVHYNYFTTLEGVMEKEDPENWEFVVPDKLKMLYEEKDYGPYGENGTMKVCFLTNHDITGGNSGSPVINGSGELVGLAFDGNWEAMSGDIAFEPELQRTISVDIRYVLFIIDKYAGARNIIEELVLVKPLPAAEKVREIKATEAVGTGTN